MNDYVALALAVVLLGLNAFFVGAEFALLSARRSQIEPLALGGSKSAKATLAAMENVSVVMAAAQLGITMCSLGLGAVGEPAVAHLLKPVFTALGVPGPAVYPISFVLALLVVVYLHVVLGEMVPKNIAIAGPARAALVLAPPMMWIVAVLRPVIAVVNFLANAILRALRVEPKDEVSSVFTREEVAALVEESRGEGILQDTEYDLLAGALGFTERTVDSVLMPSSTLATVGPQASGADVEALCATTGFSRFPVTSAGGELRGYLHIKDVLETDEARRLRPIDAKWIRPLATVRADDLLHEALAALRSRDAHMGRVVDESGAALGVVALEDVLEELVGEIRDGAHLNPSRPR